MTRASKEEGSLTGAAVWLIAAKLTAYALGLALPVLVVRKLDQHDYGVYKQIFLLINTASMLLPLGFIMSAYYYFPRRDDPRPVIGNIVTFLAGVGLFAAAAFSLAPGLVGWLTNDRENESYAPLVGLATALVMVAYFLETALIVNRETRLAGLVTLGASLSRAATLFGAAAVFGTVRSLAWALIAHAAAQTAALMGFLQSRFPGFWRAQDGKLFREQLIYTLRLAAPNYILLLQNDLHLYVVSRKYGPELFAIYATGCLQIPVILMTEAVGPLLIRQMGKLESEHDRPGIVRLAMAAARKLAAAYFPVAGFLIAVGREFLELVFTAPYRASYPVLVLNLCLLPLGIILFDPISRAFPQMQTTLLKIRVALLALLVVTMMVLLEWLGPVGAIAAVLVVTFLERVILARFWGRILGVKKEDLALAKDIGLLAVATLLAMAGAALTRQGLIGSAPWVVLTVCGAVFAAIYATVVLTSGVLRPEEARMLGRIASRVLPFGGRA